MVCLSVWWRLVGLHVIGVDWRVAVMGWCFGCVVCACGVGLCSVCCIGSMVFCVCWVGAEVPGADAFADADSDVDVRT